MNCYEFERELDVLLEGPLGPKAREALEHHAGACASCSDLLALARLPWLPQLRWLRNREQNDFTRGVLSRTSGAACRQAEESLPDFAADVVLADGDQELLAEHLEHCRSCSGLVRELDRLAVDLPRLSIVQPEISLIDDVLRRTLPVPARMRRWWTATWPQWVRRPRFASELAFMATLVLVVIFGSPVLALQAIPERAFEFARTEPFEQFEVLQTATRAEIGARLQATLDSGTESLQSLAAASRSKIGTILEEVASWFENAEDEPPANANPTTEETS